MRLTQLTYAGMAAALLCACSTVKAPEAVLPVPEQKQVDWQKMETYAFVHFGLNTFNDREWGYGDSDPLTFNPKKLDCEQWAKTFAASGMKGVILTAKHHDGFCLWPTHLTEYCIRNTPYKDGKGDIVGELAAACKKYGIKFAVYLSPWDRHQANYASPEYVEYFHKQLRELLTQYGEVFEVWFDGANGGDGWYGGAKEKRTIDRKNYYNYPAIYKMLDELQPQAIIFSDGGPGCRWVGNERGFAGATNWAFLRKGEVFPGYEKHKTLQYGHADGNQWTAAECDVSIRPGWFYHPEEDDKVKTVDQLTDLYYRSVGHNGTLLLNFPVDRNGLIHPTDSANAVNFRKNIERQLAHDLLENAKVEATSTRGGKYKAKAVNDNNWDTYWATPDNVTSATLTFSLPNKERINRMMLQEYIPLGQRVKQFIVEYEHNGEWLPIQPGEETTTVGYKRLLRFATIETSQLRVRFIDARGPLCINNVEAFYAGETNDFKPFNNEAPKSLDFKVVGINDNEDKKCYDRNETTTCTISGSDVIFDLGKECEISSFYYLPDQSDAAKGMVSNYEIYVGNAPESVNQKVASGEFSNIKNNPIWQSVFFTPANARYVKMKATRIIDDSHDMGIAEIAIK